MAKVGKRDFYEVLGVERAATPEQIKGAFRRLAMEYHPDRNPDPAASERFKEIGAAYEILSNREKRAQYDRFGMTPDLGGASGFEGFEFGGFGDIFDAFFGGRRARRAPTRGNELRVRLELEFDEAIFGGEKEIRASRMERCGVCNGSGAEPGTQRATCEQCNGAGELRRAQRSVFGQFINVTICDRCEGEGTVLTHPCAHCGGVGREQRNRRLKVKVPAGVDDGSQMRLAGEGDAGLHGGPAGNLYVQLSVKSDPVFTRQGDHLHVTLPLNFAQAALGVMVEVPTVDGDPELVEVPAGTQHGEVIVIRGKGVPHLRGRGRGDLLVETAVQVPKKLTEEQRAVVEQLQSVLGDPAAESNGSGIFSRLKDAFTG